MTTSSLLPGIHDGIPSEQYHAHPNSISSSGLRRLLPPHCPAVYRYGEFESSDTLDFGKVAHRLVLGEGDDFEVAPFDSWRTKAAQEFKAAANESGKVPILRADYAKAYAMAMAVARHPWAGKLFTEGKAEQSLVWTDPDTGVTCRARFDWLRDVVEGRRLIIPDYKTARSAHPEKFARSAADFGYHQQAAFYIDGAIALGLDPDPAFVFVVQEKQAPYLVTVVELDDEAIKLGRALNQKALRIYAECVANDDWPGYHDGVASVALPNYYVYSTEEFLSNDD